MKLGYMMLLVAVGAMLVVAPAFAEKPAGKGDKGHGDKNIVFGEVTKIEGTTITIAVKGKKDAPPAATEKAITTDGSTKFVIGAKGEEKDGTIADVKVGGRIFVTLAADGTTATKVAVLPAKDGEHKKK